MVERDMLRDLSRRVQRLLRCASTMCAAFLRCNAVSLQVHTPSSPGAPPKKLGSVSEFCAEYCGCALLIAKGSGQHS